MCSTSITDKEYWENTETLYFTHVGEAPPPQ